MEQVAFTYVKLKKLDQENIACPTDFFGETIDGMSFYCRYRWGKLRIEVNDVVIFYALHGDEYDGLISWEEVKSIALRDRIFIDDEEADVNLFDWNLE
ncbi:hypothetical protein QO179_23665 [Bacillus stercoris]|nr:hypothetical protein [Bacillus stercoris]